MNDCVVEGLEFADVETASDSYAARFSGEIGAWLLSVQSAGLNHLLKDLPTATVLDVAGGHGHVARALSSSYEVTVLGSSHSCDLQIKDLVQDCRCKFEIGSVETLPFPDKSFDVVTCFRYLSHTNNWEKTISELVRVARKRVIVDYPVTDSLNCLNPLLFKVKRRLEGNTRRFIVFRRAQIEQAFKNNNFALKESVRQFFLPMALHRTLRQAKLSSRLEGGFKRLGCTALLGSPVISAFVPAS
ncbi:MAG: class I SAM-dependent methyltransferase [Deltaproteobacteria bacterium]|nr:class I SAM-dependent methyltransferase [Deltaproteobacteria bacterium]